MSGGPMGRGERIAFGISVRMTPNLKKHIVRLGENLWKPYREDAGMISECADLLNYWPEEEDRPEGRGRWLHRHPHAQAAGSFRRRQRGKYFVVGSNRWDWDAARLRMAAREGRYD